MSDVKARLKGMETAWKQGKDVAPGPPDGVYTLQLQAASLKVAESSGKLYIGREHLVIDGEFSGEVVRDMLSLETEKGPYFVAQWIEQMGYAPPDSVEEIEEVVNAISAANPTYTGSIKRSGDFINVRVRELLSSGEEGEGEAEAPAPAPIPSQKSAAPISKAKPIPASNTSGWSIGSVVEYDNANGEAEAGTIVAFEGEEAHVQDGAGGVWGVPLADLRPAPTPEPDDPTLPALIALAQAYGLDIMTEDDTVQTAAEKLGAYDWDFNELTAEESKLLSDNGIVLKNLPQPKPAAPKPKPKPAAKAAPSAPAPAKKPAVKKK